MVTASLAFTATASADLDEVNTKKLRDGVTINGMLAHERAFQFIANANGGRRASGTPGHDASADYVVQRLRDAGYNVRRQTFNFRYYTMGRSKSGLFEDGSRKAAKKTAKVKRMHADAAR